MAKRPWISLILVILITMGALVSIVDNGVDFSMRQEDFTPDNPIIEASQIVDEAFSSTANKLSVVRADNVFTKQAFLAALEYEKALLDNATVLDFLATSDGSSIISPIKGIAMGIAMSPPANIPNPTLDQMIGIISTMNDTQVATAAGFALDPAVETPESQMLRGLFSSDLSFDGGKASAVGSLILLTCDKDMFTDGMESTLKLENAIASVVDNVAADLVGTGVKVQAMNEGIFMDEMGDIALNDLSMLFPLALVCIVALMILMYRDFWDMVVSLLCLLTAIVWTFGFGTAIGIGITTVSMAVPILVLGLGIDYGIHLVFRYREKRVEGGDAVEAAGYTMSTVGEALLLATFTTVVAFLSYLTSSMQMLADFGLLSALGILSSFVVMLLTMPATQALRDKRAEAKGIDLQDTYRYRDRQENSRDIVGSISGLGGRMAAARPIVTLAIAGIVLVGFGVASLDLDYEFDLFDFIPEGTEEAEIIQFIATEFGSTGQASASVLVYGDATDPALIAAMEKSVERMAGSPHVLMVNGDARAEHLGTVLHEAFLDANTSPTYKFMYQQAFGANGKILSAATELQVVSALGILVMEETDAMENHGVPPTYLPKIASVMNTYEGKNVTRIIVTVSDTLDSDVALEIREGLLTAVKPLEGFDPIVTSDLIAQAVVMDEMSDSQMESLFLTLVITAVVLSLVMYFLYQAPALGILAIIPTLISVVAVWGTMALLSVPMNVMTITIAALTVGMGVTYGIHINHRYEFELRQGLSPREAAKRTTRLTGKGVLGAALTTFVGFGVIGFSIMVPIQQFGLIAALSILFSYIGATFVLPSMLVIWAERRPRPVQRQILRSGRYMVTRVVRVPLTGRAYAPGVRNSVILFIDKDEEALASADLAPEEEDVLLDEAPVEVVAIEEPAPEDEPEAISELVESVSDEDFEPEEDEIPEKKKKRRWGRKMREAEDTPVLTAEGSEDDDVDSEEAPAEEIDGDAPEETIVEDEIPEKKKKRRWGRKKKDDEPAAADESEESSDEEGNDA